MKMSSQIHDFSETLTKSDASLIVRITRCKGSCSEVLRLVVNLYLKLGFHCDESHRISVTARVENTGLGRWGASIGKTRTLFDKQGFSVC